MPNTVKPILVERRPLSEIEHEWSYDNDDEFVDIFDEFDNLRGIFFSVCARLRKEVKRHKETKKKLKEALERIVELEAPGIEEQA